ncbi:signal peptidase II [Candidatus Margulisiibacteriota bacterium]
MSTIGKILGSIRKIPAQIRKLPLPVKTGVGLIVLDKATQYAARSANSGTSFKNWGVEIGYHLNTRGIFGRDYRPDFLMDVMSSNSYEIIKTALILGGTSAFAYLSRRSLSMVSRVGLSLFIAGSAANLFCRLLHDGVIDIAKFLLIHEYAFNWADVGITIGIPIFLIGLLTDSRSKTS